MTYVSRLSVEQLELIRELADCGSLSGVAAATHRTPSAVSQQLKSLQRQLGVSLVQRVGRGLELTEAGRTLAGAAVGVREALAEADAIWQDYLGEAVGTVRLACFYSAGELLVPGLVERLAAFPGISLETFDEDVSQVDFASLTGTYDVVVAHRSDDTAAEPAPQARRVPLFREPLDVAMALDHRLADQTSVEPADLVGEAWISPPVGFPIERALAAVAARSGAPARVVRRSTHLPLHERLVARGLGIALLPRFSAPGRVAGAYALLPLTGLRIGRYVEALVRRDRASRRVVAIVIEQLQAEAASVTG